jgi:hypothetical protein
MIEPIETMNSLNLKFKIGEMVDLIDSMSELPRPIQYTVEKIEIDGKNQNAVMYFLTPKPKGGVEWYLSNQLKKVRV